MGDEAVSERSTRFDGSIPEMYDRYLGPLLFEPFAADIADRVARRRPRKVLEIAAGTGIVSRAMMDRLPRETSLTISDLNAPMLDYARQKVGTHRRDVEWRQGDAQKLPLQGESFDMVVCQFGLMFFPDKRKGLREFYRVLEKGGSLVFSVWDSIDQNPVQSIAHSTIATFFETAPPDFYQIPCGMGDLEVVRRLTEEAGFKDIVIEPVSLTGTSESAQNAAVGLVKGNPVINAIRERGTADVDEIIRTVARVLEDQFGALSLQVPLRAHVVTAVKA
ncbi:MAG TPA: class I SAM-dependent methyltransferase [Gemmatimonadaceae bacterium]|nr:class I SAM-dependent methyltransferase [Gemmatimonadaceae bacterium]